MVREEIPDYHVLVVDDAAPNRKILQRILGKQRRIAEAQNGRQALELLAQETFDLVLLDIMMPEVSGLEVLERIRSTPKIADLPVILISALSQTKDIVEGLRIGANDYIVKPFDLHIVTARIDTQLRTKKALDIQKQAIVELEAAQKLKDRLFRIASHDLKSPLSNVYLAERLLREIAGDDKTISEILDQLSYTVAHMNQVIEDFLDMAAVQSGSFDLQLAKINVQSVIHDVMMYHQMSAVNKCIQLQTGEWDGFIYVDRARVTQILSNLVSNAIKYSPPGSTVDVWAEPVENRVRIHIIDQGPGIPENEREKLFTEFGKLSTRPTADESSTGLGLWIVKQMVALQNGAVDVDCPPEGGSDFWVDFPAVD